MQKKSRQIKPRKMKQNKTPKKVIISESENQASYDTENDDHHQAENSRLKVKIL